MNMIAADPTAALSEVRRQVQSHCQSLVDTGTARWWVNDDGGTELHLDSGEAYLFDELGLTRLR